MLLKLINKLPASLKIDYSSLNKTYEDGSKIGYRRCVNCGIKLALDHIFCTYCGFKQPTFKLCEKCLFIIPKSYDHCIYCDDSFSRKSKPEIVHKINTITCEKCHAKSVESASFCRACGDFLLKGEFRFANFWMRLGAWLIDCTIIFLLLFVMVTLFHIFGYETSIVNKYLAADLIVLLILIYFSLFAGLLSTSPGKKILGLKLVSEDGGNISWQTSINRAILQLATALFFGIGYLFMLKNGREQAWHDIGCRTYVVQQINL